ncbi:hypothetical protein CC86DRAFT_278824 [Ophiobolus disseminans]|uniref:Uncharacterized protein n=1 Tax=Ophiobolus disseminans TaxID=1469910 RepID=A0A6A7AK07_9PLEO|nr:hypothetical protein CC86DRAFT_278824 [Ophiobolus disseminans]
MHIGVQEPGHYRVNPSGTTTPGSTRSSFSYESNVSSNSTSSRPKRSLMKSSLKSTASAGVVPTRRFSPPTVRFAEPEPLPRPKPTPIQQHQSNRPERNSVPNPLIQYRHRPASSVASSASSSQFTRPQSYSALPPHGVPSPQSGQIQYMKTRVGQRTSAPVQPSRPAPGIPLPANFTPPSLAFEQRVSSFQSVASNLSVQSAPAVLQAPPSSSPPSQYNPLEHYIPCLHTTCKTHYSPVHGGPTYYLPQGPYTLPKHHGYCPQHASKELRETNAACKREWESLRQNAGRQTLGQIANEFDSFLHAFRQDRRAEDADLLRRQRRIVLGAAHALLAGAQTQQKRNDASDWDWSYTPRHCTRSACSAAPYSPFANHLHAFYHSPRSSTFAPLLTLCPPCAKNEVEAFERYVVEKWGSRCGWEDELWNEWFGNAVADRSAERDFWLGAQERVVRERGPARSVQREVRQKEEEESRGEEKIKEGKKGVWKRLFGGVMGE